MRTLRLIALSLLVPFGCAKSASPTADTQTSRVDTIDAANPSIPVPAVPRTSAWELDPENSSAEFVVKHVLSKVRGFFPKPAGKVVFDDANPSNSKVDATIDVNGITTGVEERDTHLKSEDFFDAAKYPTITFVSKTVTKASATAYSVSGDLTMHGVTRPVTLAVAASAPFEHAGGIRRGIEATTTINRKDFGLRWEFPGEGPGIVVGDMVRIVVNAELVLEAGAFSAASPSVNAARVTQ